MKQRNDNAVNQQVASSQTFMNLRFDPKGRESLNALLRVVVGSPSLKYGIRPGPRGSTEKPSDFNIIQR